MWNIFGDTDDITFGAPWAGRSSTPDPRPRDDHAPRPPRPPRPSTPRAMTPRPPLPQDRPRDIIPPRRESRPRVSAPFTPPTPISLATSLATLIGSMKPTYLPPASSENMRVVLLSNPNIADPLMLVRSLDQTLLFGTGFSTIENAGKSYATFPDMRLLESERERLAGWILLEAGFDIALFQMILEMLGFPFVYGNREVIAYIRDTVRDADFLEKCRFFELFSPESQERKVAEFHLKNTPHGIALSLGGRGCIDAIHAIDPTAGMSSTLPTLSKTTTGYTCSSGDIAFLSGEILDIGSSRVTKDALKFTFDTFYRDEQSIGVVAGYALRDREELAENGVLTFVLEEDAQSRAIVGHIFIDSRGFVHAYEMMSVHKQILKGIRHTYEDAIMANPRVERGELVQILRRELTKYCYLITGRTPVVMPIIIER